MSKTSVKKFRPKFQKRPVPRKKFRGFPAKTALIVGVDISTSSIAMAASGYDPKLKTYKGPEFTYWRWNSGVHYFDRLADVSKPQEFIFDLLNALKITPELHEIFIAVEEPWPLGLVGRAQSNALKQQAEISGAFLGGLLRYGYRNIFQIPANSWRSLVADDLGISIHHSKWRDPELCEIYNCKPADTGKFRSKQWALKNFTVPDWPDIIQHSTGKIPRPEGSRAKAVQPDDRYDALAIMEWCRLEYLRGAA